MTWDIEGRAGRLPASGGKVIVHEFDFKAENEVIYDENGVKVIHINFSSASVDPVYFPQVEVVGDIANAVWQLMEQLESEFHQVASDFEEIQWQDS